MVRADSQWTGASLESWHAFFREMGAQLLLSPRAGRAGLVPWGNYNQYYYARGRLLRLPGLGASAGVGAWQLCLTGPEHGPPAGGTLEAWHLEPGRRGEGFFCPGDIVSIRTMSGFAWGTCEDGSLVILHATPSPAVPAVPAEVFSSQGWEKSKLPGACLGPAVYGAVPGLEPAL